MASDSGERQLSASRAALTYNAYRLGLLAVCLGIGWLATLRGIVLILLSLAVSGVASWFLLRPQREAMGRAVEQTVERSLVRQTAKVAAEDAYVDAMLAKQTPPDATPGETASAPGDQPPS